MPSHCWRGGKDGYCRIVGGGRAFRECVLNSSNVEVAKMRQSGRGEGARLGK